MCIEVINSERECHCVCSYLLSPPAGKRVASPSERTHNRLKTRSGFPADWVPAVELWVVCGKARHISGLKSFAQLIWANTSLSPWSSVITAVKRGSREMTPVFHSLFIGDDTSAGISVCDHSKAPMIPLYSPSSCYFSSQGFRFLCFSLSVNEWVQEWVQDLHFSAVLEDFGRVWSALLAATPTGSEKQIVSLLWHCKSPSGKKQKQAGNSGNSPGSGERRPPGRCCPSSSSTPASEQTQSIHQTQAEDLSTEINFHLIMSSLGSHITWLMDFHDYSSDY